MNISKDMMNEYLGYITGFYMLDHPDEPAEDFANYDSCIEEIRLATIDSQDVEPFRLALDWVLLFAPPGFLTAHGGTYYWQDDEILPVVRYIRRTLYPRCPRSRSGRSQRRAIGRRFKVRLVGRTRGKACEQSRNVS